MNTAYTYPNQASATQWRQTQRTRPYTAHRQRLSSESRRIAYTDHIHARIVLGGRVVAELRGDRVDGYSAMLTTLRAMIPHTCQGLAKLYVRNMSRGWSLERPLMLYATAPATPAARPPMPWDI